MFFMDTKCLPTSSSVYKASVDQSPLGACSAYLFGIVLWLLRLLQLQQTLPRGLDKVSGRLLPRFEQKRHFLTFLKVDFKCDWNGIKYTKKDMGLVAKYKE